jgi:hypothetical protein
MKANKILLIVLFGITLFSCKNDAKNESSEATATTQEVKKNQLIITINALVLKDDSFQVYYRDTDSQDPFDEKKSQYAVFKGSPTAQDIVFALPEDELPSYFRFDYGINKEQSEIVINNVKIEYLGKSFVINNNELDHFISFNIGTLTFNKEKGSITPFVLKDGSYDPMSFTGITMHDKIQELIK